MTETRHCLRCGQPVTVGPTWSGCACPGGNATLTVDAPPPAPVRSQAIDWHEVHRTTRWQPTVTTFGWQVKLAITLPFPLLLCYLIVHGVLGGSFDAFSVFTNDVPLLLLSLWWAKKVWTPGHPERRVLH